MKKLLEFIIFISYTILIFNLRKGLMIIFIANMIFMVVLKINLKKALYNILDFGIPKEITTKNTSKNQGCSKTNSMHRSYYPRGIIMRQVL